MTGLTPNDEFKSELARTFGKEIVDTVFFFITDILRPPAKELGGLFADKVRGWRLDNQFKIIRKAIEFQKETGIKKQQIPIKLVAELIENCSWEEDEDIQMKWSALLSNATTENENTDIYLSYVEILRQLSPAHVKLLDYMYSEEELPARRALRSSPNYHNFHNSYTLQKKLQLSNDDYHMLVDGLVRLNLVNPTILYKENRSKIEIERSYKEISLTYFGTNFVKKCRFPFTKSHEEKIAKELQVVVEKIAMDYKCQEAEEFAERVVSIYEYASPRDVGSAIIVGLDEILWKEKANSYSDFPLTNTQKQAIINTVIKHLREDYS